MDLQSIECQLAQAQMARYLAGDQLPEDTVKQLEKHITDCAVCQKSAADKQISLEKMLNTGPAEPAPAPTPYEEPEAEATVATAVPMPEPESTPAPEPAPAPAPTPSEESAPKDPFADLTSVFSDPEPLTVAADPVEELETEAAAEAPTPAPVAEPTPAAAQATDDADQASEPAAKKKGIPTKTVTITVPDLGLMTKGNLKTLAMAGGLGVVLIAMAVTMRGTKDVLGEKAMTAKATESDTEKEPAEDEKPKAASKKHEEPSNAEPKPAASHAAKAPSHEPKAVDPPKTAVAAVAKNEPTPAPTHENAEEYVVASGDGGVKKASIENGKQVSAKPVSAPAKQQPKPQPKPTPPAPKATTSKPKSTVTKRYRRSYKSYRRHTTRRAKPKSIVRVYEEES